MDGQEKNLALINYSLNVKPNERFRNFLHSVGPPRNEIQGICLTRRRAKKIYQASSFSSSLYISHEWPRSAMETSTYTDKNRINTLFMYEMYSFIPRAAE